MKLQLCNVVTTLVLCWHNFVTTSLLDVVTTLSTNIGETFISKKILMPIQPIVRRWLFHCAFILSLTLSRCFPVICFGCWSYIWCALFLFTGHEHKRAIFLGNVSGIRLWNMFHSKARFVSSWGFVKCFYHCPLLLSIPLAYVILNVPK